MALVAWGVRRFTVGILVVVRAAAYGPMTPFPSERGRRDHLYGKARKGERSLVVLFRNPAGNNGKGIQELRTTGGGVWIPKSPIPPSSAGTAGRGITL